MIIITSAPSSGSTLLKRLFYSFEGCSIIDKEVSIVNLSHKPNDVCKLLKKEVMSRIHFTNQKETGVIRAVLKSNIIINMVRDGRDVVDSGIANIGGWVQSIEEYIKYKHLVDCLLYFEDLTNSPDLMQREIAKVTGLTIKNKFSEYPNFVNQDVVKREGFDQTNYQLRPICSKRKKVNEDKFSNLGCYRKRFSSYCKMIENRDL